MHTRHFPFTSMLLKDKSDGGKVVQVIFVHESYFMVNIEVIEDVLQVNIDNRTQIGLIKVVETVQEVANAIVVGIAA